ncbi:thiol-disulfide oxidoreductase DCC family protein [Kitasatospora sp. NPDC050543]|uniref:thiol-disulfide oxidoreductase DCC family protein n=1 Tax=Kitasatospora sp. NPDC050543 TaxID=3364054 RepID=UPI0037A42D49
MTTDPAPQAEPSVPPPVTRITVLHDPACPLCRHLTAWLRGRYQLVPLEFVAVASAEARERFPGLDHDATLGEITVVADTGEVWRGPQAFVICLWALAEYRPLARRLSTPTGLPVARAAAFAASKYRAAVGAGRAAPGAEGTSGTARPGAVAGRTQSAAHPVTDPYGEPYRPPAYGCVDGACSVSG